MNLEFRMQNAKRNACSFARVIAFILVAFSANFAATYFEDDFTVWQDGEYLIWTQDDDLPLDPAEFCLSMRRANSGIGQPTCRELGEWQRDTVSAMYGKWLKDNLEDGISPELLRARSPMMQAKINSLEDKIVLFVTRAGSDLKVAVFNETIGMPKAAGTVPYSTDKVILGDAVANKFLKKDAERRLTKAERIKKATEPDAVYQPAPTVDVWTGISAAYSQARIPLTPYSWYKNKLNSRVKRYRVTRDSLSLWNFLDDQVPIFSVYGGATWYGIFGGEIFYKYSNHDVKIDKNDTTYRELDHWAFGMHEIGLSIHVTHSFNTTEWLTSSPFAYAGFQYTFLSENIGRKKHAGEASSYYQTRIEFEDVYKGAVFGIGSRFVVKQNYGLVFRAGLATQGRADYTSPDVNAAEEPTTIGKLTVEGFVSAGLEYHLTWK